MLTVMLGGDLDIATWVRVRVRVRGRFRVGCFIVTGGHKWVLYVRQRCRRRR